MLCPHQGSVVCRPRPDAHERKQGISGAAILFQVSAFSGLLPAARPPDTWPPIRGFIHSLPRCPAKDIVLTTGVGYRAARCARKGKLFLPIG
jgi:hypothetical protein